MTSRYFVISSLILLIYLNYCTAFQDVNCNDHSSDNTMRITLHRQQSLLERHINSRITNYGKAMDWFLDKPLPPANATNITVALYRFLDHEFYGKIVIGHPGQTLNVAFDTTWTYSWVLSSQCDGLEAVGCYFHNKYNHYKSSEYKPDGRKFVVDTGTYKLKGFYSYDNISVTNSNVTNFSFIEMIEVPKTFIFNKADGVIGLGRANGDYNPFFNALVQQKKINDTIFSVYINRNHQSPRGGTVLLGAIDCSHVKVVSKKNTKKIYDDFVYRPVNKLVDWWEFDLQEVVMTFDPKRNETVGPKNVKAIIDTSSSTIIGPVEAVAQIHERIQATKMLLNRYVVDCDRVNSLPKISFIIGNKVFEFTGPKYITKLTWRSITVCLSSFQAASNANEQGKWFLGTAFLAEVYTVYKNGVEIGFVRAA